MRSNSRLRITVFCCLGLAFSLPNYAQGKGKGKKNTPTFEASFREGDDRVTGIPGYLYQHGTDGLDYENFLLDLDPGGNTSDMLYFEFDFSEPWPVGSEPENPVACDTDPAGCDITTLDFVDPEDIDYRFALRTVEAHPEGEEPGSLDPNGGLFGMRCDDGAYPNPANAGDPAPELLDMELFDCIRGRVNFRLARFGQVNDELFIRCGRLDNIEEGSSRDQRGTDDVRVECTGLGSDDRCSEWTVTPFLDGADERLVCRVWDNVLGRGKKSTITKIGDFNIPFGVTVTRQQ